MLRSLVAVLLSCFLAIPLAAQPYNHAPASTSASSTTGPVGADSTEPDGADREPFEGEEWNPSWHSTHDYVTSSVGIAEGPGGLFKRVSTAYRAAPPIRYNRVEGLVLGIRREPLALGSAERAKVYGQVGYAFGLRDVRYTIGIESQLLRDEETGLKIGAAYQEQTLTPDRWKTSFAENSLAGFGFGYDYFDYYEAEGVSIYAVQALPHSIRLTAGFRTETHRSLNRETRWSLFGIESFRENPAAEEGRLHAAFVGLRGGHIRDYDGLPSGAVFHLAATIGEPFGGDLLVNRYRVAGRAFLPLTPDTRLGVRLRGGYATSSAPIQTQFSLGGIGSLRSYGQNAVRGTRMMLGNVEYMVDGATVFDDFLDDLFVAGLFDAGWVGTSGERFRLDEVLPSAGFSVGLDERQVRLDVTWPLRMGPHAGSGPSVWLRIAPNF